MTARISLLLFLSVMTLTSLFCSIFLNQHDSLSYHDTALRHEIIRFIRLPHALTAFVAGGLLALAGAFMQILLRNPLADPYILGVSGGAAIGTLLFMLCGLSGYWLTGGAWGGSVIIIFILFLLTPQKQFASHTLLLTGIALASGCSAIISLILSISPDHAMRSMLFWLMGDLSYARLPVFESIILFLSLLYSFTFARDLNLLIQGEQSAKSLGVQTQKIQRTLFFLSALLTATAVTLVGCIGFIGLIVPHSLRILCGNDHRFLLPGCVLLGGSLLVIADLLARTLFFPQALPVGVIMALMGIPIFLILLRKN
jgi:iron complex transport system permease protein